MMGIHISSQKRIFRLVLLVILFFMGITGVLMAQSTGAEGFVLDDATGKPLPYVNIYFANTTIGTISDATGRFRIKTMRPVDTLVFSEVGYRTVKLGMKKGIMFHLVVRMKKNNTTLNEVVIKPGENPAFHIIREVIRNRKKNDPDRLNRFSTETYTNISASLTNINLSDVKSKMIKQLKKFLPKQKNTTHLGFIPLYYSEKLTSNYIDHKNHISESQLILHKENGLGMLKDFQITGYTNSLSVVMNFYNNYVGLLGHNFVSPVGGLGRQFYKYYLSDSTRQNGRIIYTIKYVPKNKKDLAFRGKFTVIKGLWAIKHVDASLPQVSNINFLNRFNVSYDYQLLDDSIPFFKSNSIQATFNYNKLPDNNRTMLQLDKTTVYSHIRFGNAALRPSPLEKKKSQIVLQPASDSLLYPYRKITSNMSSAHVLRAIDSINNVRWVKILNKTANMFATGYYNVGRFDIGPFLNLIQYNKVEGLRLSFGGRTSVMFSPHYSFGMLAGYGFKDHKWKYNAYFSWKFNTPKRTLVRFWVSRDLQLFGVYGHIHLIKENMLSVGEDSFISAVFKRAQNERRAMFFRAYFNFEHEWRKGVTTMFKLEYDQIQDNQYVPFIQNGVNIGQIRNQDITARLRLSWHEKTMDKFLRRYYLGTHYPIVNILGTVGRYEAGIFTGNYFKVHMTVKHRFMAGIPMIRYILETGALWGKVPFPLLEIHRGNESYGYSRFRFNLLNNATIASDRYFSLMGEVFMNGLILNRIPLVRSLNLRTVFSFKYLYSSLSNVHALVVKYPWDMHLPGNQYLEVGVGLDNIFRFLRVDYVYRLIPKRFPPMPKWGIRFKIDVDL